MSQCKGVRYAHASAPREAPPRDMAAHITAYPDCICAARCPLFNKEVSCGTIGAMEGHSDESKENAVIPLWEEIPLPSALQEVWEKVSIPLENATYDAAQKLRHIQSAVSELLQKTEGQEAVRAEILRAARQYLSLIQSMNDNTVFDALAPEGSLPEHEPERAELRARMREGFEPHMQFLKEVVRKFSSQAVRHGEGGEAQILPFSRPTEK